MPNKNKPYIVGICGGSGSGKTYILKQIVKQFGEENICVFGMDNYYLDKESQTRDENDVVNYDMPTAIALDRYATDLEKLKKGGILRIKEYTFNNPQAEEKWLSIEPRPIIVVEGLFVFFNAHIREQLDLKIFLDVEDIIKLKRRILRDNVERGYDLHDVLYRYEKHVLPSFLHFVLPYKGMADLIIPNHKNCVLAVEILTNYLKTKI